MFHPVRAGRRVAGRRLRYCRLLQFATQLVVAGDDTFFLQAADILKSAGGLFHVTGKYIFLFVEAEKVHILTEQEQFDFGFATGRIECCNLFLQRGTFDIIMYFTSAIDGLGYFYIIIM